MFDPELLAQVIRELGRELVPLAKDPRLKEIQSTLTLCDGTLLKALPRLAESMWKHSRTGNVMHGWRMHCQFELDRHVPAQVELSDYRNAGKSGRATNLPVSSILSNIIAQPLRQQ